MRFLARASSVTRPRGPAVPESSADDLVDLMAAVSRGRRDAFAALYDRTSGAIRADLTSTVEDPRRAAEVLVQTYVEVWWLAGCYRIAEGDVLTWIRRIAGRRAVETGPRGNRFPGPPISARPIPAARELALLLERPPKTFGTG